MQEVIVAIIVALAAGAFVRRIYKNLTQEEVSCGCGGGCAGCGQSPGSCGSRDLLANMPEESNSQKD
ncbi:hypothetical protein Dalk_4623 [Desulfatibacillum aliphaticivorans]|uniref:FeoB-associated Cys-rich membrane protein n=1 Tax=Desulfatibacillum aliphaticivorans TaxID=218208 RepID=B8FNM0_DESAL|nr:FeoB-associated Cys-rich membrane protein [Desulfatibacillum aliphaticivorans]ACL06301.1 hypothetical protein Dalk_4623 [Desulfatibacillum aliphaticivorans]